VVCFFAALAAKFWKREISSASERAFPGFLAICLVAQLSPKRGVLVHKNYSLLVNSVVTAKNHALCRVLSNIVIWLLGHFWVDTPHINSFEGDSVLSKFVVCCPPSRSCRTRLGLCQRKRFSQKRFRLRFTPKRTCTILHSTECMSTRQSRYETVRDGSNEDNSSHLIVLFCQRYWLAGVGGCDSGQRALGGQDSPILVNRVTQT